MGRPGKFDSERVLDAALEVLARDGMRGLTVSRVCVELGAPSGSLYHRFASRDDLLVALWLRSAERFQQAIVDAFDNSTTPREAAHAVVRCFIARTRQHRAEAMVLNVYRRSDLVEGDWPEGVRSRAKALQRMQRDNSRRFAARLWPDGGADPARMNFALLRLPLAVAMGELHGEPQHAQAVDWVLRAVDAVLADCW